MPNPRATDTRASFGRLQASPPRWENLNEFKRFIDPFPLQREPTKRKMSLTE